MDLNGAYEDEGRQGGPQVVMSARWLLLRNRENIKTDANRIHLDELLATNSDAPSGSSQAASPG